MADFAQSNAQALYRIPETTFGSTPGSGTAAQFRMTGESLAPAISATASTELDTAGDVADLIQTDFATGGDVSVEWSYGNVDLEIAAVLGHSADGTWTTAGLASASGTTISFTAPDTIADSGSGFGSFAIGDVIEVKGSTDNDGVYRVTAAAAGSLTVDKGTITTESAGDSVTVSEGEYAGNGTTLTSFAIFKHYTDLTSDLYEEFNGKVVDSLSISIAPGAILTGQLSYAGKASAGLTTTDPMAALTKGSKPTSDVMNAITDVEVWIGGAQSTVVTSLELSFAANARATPAVGELGAKAVSRGTLNVTGSATLLLDSATEAAKAIAFTDSDVVIKFSNLSSGQTEPDRYAIVMPRTKYSAVSNTNAGENTDIELSLEFQAIRGTATNQTYTTRFYRWAGS